MTAKIDTGVVLIHGAGLGSWIWDDVAHAMDLPTLAVDLPGRGSSYHTRKKLELEDYTQEVMRQIDAWNVQNVVLVAHSLSGVVALQLAKKLGKRLVGLVGVGAVFPTKGKSFLSVMPFPKNIVMNLVMMAAGTQPTESAIRDGLCSDLSEEQADEVVRRFLPESRHAFADKTNVEIPKVKSWYIKLENDAEFSLDLQNAMTANMYMPEGMSMDTGHMPMLKNPKRLAEILNIFMGTL